MFKPPAIFLPSNRHDFPIFKYLFCSIINTLYILESLVEEKLTRRVECRATLFYIPPRNTCRKRIYTLFHASIELRGVNSSCCYEHADLITRICYSSSANSVNSVEIFIFICSWHFSYRVRYDITYKRTTRTVPGRIEFYVEWIYYLWNLCWKCKQNIC